MNLDEFEYQLYLIYRNARAETTKLPELLPTTWPNIYHEAQASIPAGAHFLAVASPLYFDFRRNIVENVDTPGAASPEPGMPIFRGPESVKAYLANQGIHYIVLGDIHRDTMYNADTWNIVLRDKAARPDQVTIAKNMLPFLDDMEALEQTNDVIYDHAPLRVIHLR